MWFGDVLDALGLDRVHLYGESQGAWHAALVALGAPERVASLSLVEPNGFITRTPIGALLTFVCLSVNPTPKGWARMSAWLTPGVTVPARERALAAAALKFRPSLGYARVLPDDELGRLGRVPLLAVFGSASVLIDVPTTTARLRALVPAARIEVVDGGGHGVRAQKADQVESVLTEFLAVHDLA
ncbi:alpha/beta fold hydrolase [Isoptericola variabilis]|uniref:alpha/beta fold hydrolase n=1 Tax=Isoptericola variabilis TaxID=139208 RepID=UPI0003141546|nr:alpha/beta hydrolase [Isoptericola variabilis]TWH34170.1 pimeloyl-ACP methyl ester carboxylesterase [Isoptericola variabilis J7]